MNAEPSPREGHVVQQGPIREGVVPGVLRGLYVGRRTGTLTFTREDERRGVHFRHGSIVNADTNVRDDRLGAVLVREGRLGEADRRRAEGFALRDHRRLGTVLVELGLLDTAGLEEALALHVDAVLSKVFAWSDGRYEFRQFGELPLADGEVTLRVSTGDLILQAARSVQDPEVISHSLGDLERVLVASSDPLLRFQSIRLAPLDGFVLSRVDGVLSARAIVELIPAPAPEVERSLFALLSTGVLTFRAADARPRPRPGAEEPPPVDPTVVLDRPVAEAAPPLDQTVILDRPVAEQPPPLDQTVILDRPVAEQPPPVDPTIVLDRPVAEAAPPLDQTVILDHPVAEQPPPVDPTVVLDRPVADAPPAREQTGVVDLPVTEEPPPVDPTVVIDRPGFEEAAALDSTLVLHGSFSPMPAAELLRIEILDLYQGLKTRNHFELLGVPREAAEAQVREAYFRLAKRFHPDREHEADLAGLRDALEAIFRRLGEAYEVLRNPRIRAAYERNLGRVPMIAPVEIADPASGEFTAVTAEDLLARAAESFSHERYWEVVRVLEKVLPRAEGPLKQRGRVLLARAYLKTPGWAKQAEELLLSVVQQHPDDAEAHFHLGVIYHSQGLPSRALTAFRRTVELVPGHPEAQRHMAEIQKTGA